MTICWERADLLDSAFADLLYVVLIVCVPFPFGVWGRMWNSIASVPVLSSLHRDSRVKICHYISKSALNSSVIYRSKAVILCNPYFVSLCGFYHCVFHVESYLASCSHDFSVHFSIVITSLGEERADIYASRVFICLSCTHYLLSFSLPLDVGGWLLSDCGSTRTCGLTFWILHSQRIKNIKQQL